MPGLASVVSMKFEDRMSSHEKSRRRRHHRRVRVRHLQLPPTIEQFDSFLLFVGLAEVLGQAAEGESIQCFGSHPQTIECCTGLAFVS